jgi:hypothetical protein
MLVHLDALTHAWLPGQPMQDPSWPSTMGWKSRRRTISKPSSALAGRQEFGVRRSHH